jgi:hypothetical protein
MTNFRLESVHGQNYTQMCIIMSKNTHLLIEHIILCQLHVQIKFHRNQDIIKYIILSVDTFMTDMSQ